MVPTVFRLDYHIIHINFYLFMYHIMQQCCRNTLEGGTSILKAEWHDSVAICSLRGDEQSLLHILWCHLDLIVSTETIHGG